MAEPTCVGLGCGGSGSRLLLPFTEGVPVLAGAPWLWGVGGSHSRSSGEFCIFLRLLDLVGGGNQAPLFYGCWRKRVSVGFMFSYWVLQAKRGPVSGTNVCLCVRVHSTGRCCGLVPVRVRACMCVHVCARVRVRACMCVRGRSLDFAAGEQGLGSQWHLASPRTLFSR